MLVIEPYFEIETKIDRANTLSEIEKTADEANCYTYFKKIQGNASGIF